MAWNAENSSKDCLGWLSCKHGQHFQFSDSWLLLEAAMICYLQHEMWTLKFTLNISLLKIFRENFDRFLASDQINSYQIEVLTSVMTRGNSKHKNLYLLTTLPILFQSLPLLFLPSCFMHLLPITRTLQLHTAFLAEVMYWITIPSMSKCQHLQFTWLTQTKTSLLWFKTWRCFSYTKPTQNFHLQIQYL